MSDIQ